MSRNWSSSSTSPAACPSRCLRFCGEWRSCWPSSPSKSRRQIAAIDTRILIWHRASRRSQALATIAGFGAILGSAMAVRVVQPERFGSGRDLAAWIGLVPKQSSSGDSLRLGRISKQGDSYLRRLLLNGAHAVLNSKRAKTDPWIARLLASKPRLVAAVALANKMARIAWAVMVRQTSFRLVAAV